MIIGLHGKMGAGKDTCAERLQNLTTLPVVRVAYADKMKDSLCALLDITRDQLEKWKNDPSVVVAPFRSKWLAQPLSIRQIIQRYGTEAHRDIFGQDFWLDAALPRDHDYTDALYAVTDIRFPNESQRVRELAGTVVRVVGPHQDTGDHPSEQVLDCDYTIVNTTRDDGHRTLDRQLVTLLTILALPTTTAVVEPQCLLPLKANEIRHDRCLP